MRNQCEILRLGLSNQHSIEWVIVMTWQWSGAYGVCKSDR